MVRVSIYDFFDGDGIPVAQIRFQERQWCGLRGCRPILDVHDFNSVGASIARKTIRLGFNYAGFQVEWGICSDLSPYQDISLGPPGNSSLRGCYIGKHDRLSSVFRGQYVRPYGCYPEFYQWQKVWDAPTFGGILRSECCGVIEPRFHCGASPH